MPPCGNRNTRTFQNYPTATFWQLKHPYILGSSQCHLLAIKTPIHTRIIPVPPCGNQKTFTHWDYHSATLWQWKHPYILGSCQCHLVAIEKVIHSRIIPVPPCENQIVRPYQDHSTATFLLAAINTYQDYHSATILLDLLLNINIAKISVNLISHQSFKIKSKCMYMYMYLSVYCTEMKHQNYSCSQSRRMENDL